MFKMKKNVTFVLVVLLSLTSITQVFAYRPTNDHFQSYSQTSCMKDMYHFNVGSVSLRNSTSQPIALKYTQQTSVTTGWNVSGNVSASADLKVSFLAKASVSIGGSVGSSKTTTSSTTVEFTTTVYPGKMNIITKYLAGVSSGGTVVWWSTVPFTGYGPVLRFTYSEPANGWSVTQNEVNYKVTEVK